MNKTDKIFIAGHKGMVGSAFLKILRIKGYKNLYFINKKKLDLRNQKKVSDYFNKIKPDIVIICSAKVGGIHANNSFPYEFISDNLLIQTNLIQSAYLNKVKKVLFLGSSCIYPKKSKQPMTEKMLLSGYLEKTNEQYAIAKLAGIKLCEGLMRQHGNKKDVDFRSIIPPNLFGDNDNYHELNSHVIASLIRKIKNANKNKIKSIVIWGDGTPKREFMHVDDLVINSIKILQISKRAYWKNFKFSDSHLNIGSGYEISIINLAKMICKILNYFPIIKLDKTMPNGVKRKIMSNAKVKKILKSYKSYNNQIFYKKLQNIVKNYN
jgi:GDP-L-fucose synthase